MCLHTSFMNGWVTFMFGSLCWKCNMIWNKDCQWSILDGLPRIRAILPDYEAAQFYSHFGLKFSNDKKVLFPVKKLVLWLFVEKGVQPYAWFIVVYNATAFLIWRNNWSAQEFTSCQDVALSVNTSCWFLVNIILFSHILINCHLHLCQYMLIYYVYTSSIFVWAIEYRSML